MFLPLEALDAVKMVGRFEQPYLPEHTYVGFLDPAGGTGKDSMTMAIAHAESGRAILDVIREVRPPFSPEATVADFATLFKAYGLTQATSDRYAGSWPTEAFRKQGVTVMPSERNRSQIYLAALPMIMSSQVELLDHSRLLKQLVSLERTKGSQGNDKVDAPQGQHEDVANSACGALVLAGLTRPHTFQVLSRLGNNGIAGAPSVSSLRPNSNGAPTATTLDDWKYLEALNKEKKQKQELEAPNTPNSKKTGEEE
jgi:hypothetical protein